jgi:hypothetical protein
LEQLFTRFSIPLTGESGLDGWGDTPLKVPLRKQAEFVDHEARLSYLGRLGFHWDMFRLLVNRL